MWEGGPDYDGRAGGGVVVMTLRRLAPLDDRTGLRAVDAHRLEHLRRQNLPHAALQRQPAVAEAAIGRPARTLGAQVQQPADAVPKLREQEAAAVPDVGIVHAELMPMIAQRQRLRSEEHTSELQSLMRISYAVFCLKKKKQKKQK